MDFPEIRINDEPITWLNDEIRKENIIINESTKSTIIEIVEEYIWQLDTPSLKKEIIHRIKNHPLMVKEIRKQKLNKIK